jgi:hypothetical protein
VDQDGNLNRGGDYVRRRRRSQSNDTAMCPSLGPRVTRCTSKSLDESGFSEDSATVASRRPTVARTLHRLLGSTIIQLFSLYLHGRLGLSACSHCWTDAQTACVSGSVLTAPRGPCISIRFVLPSLSPYRISSPEMSR